LKNFEKALEDATKTTELKADWPKGWTRKAAALHGQGDLLGANDAYEEALKLDPNNAQAKSGLQSVQRAMESEAGGGPGGMGGLGGMFNDPNLISKLAANPKTASLLADGQFMQKLMQMKQNPNDIGAALQDPRMLQVMSVLMGIDMSFGDPSSFGGAGGAAGGDSKVSEEEDVDMPDLRANSPPQSKARQPEKAPEPEPEPEDEEAIAKQKAKAEADEEKKLGTESYKKRQFDDAIAHYTKAWDLHKDITYLTNLSAAYFEKGDYDECIEAAKKAIAEGREVYADFKLIAKAYGRVGSAYEKKGDLANAVDNYQRSLTEHRTPDVLNKLRAAEKAKIKAEKDSYINPEEAEKARELGNEKFKAADWPAAVEAYTEMIKRAPEDPRGYSNRAASFIKLLAFPSAVQDCDQAIKHDPKFIRAYLRKAQALFAMREYNKCIDACEAAMEKDEGGKNAREIMQQQEKAIQAQFSAREGETEEQTSARIQNDPEVSISRSFLRTHAAR
jgi:stress-induced-phosphoprotein 1